MKNFKLTIEYDGSRYSGWQRLGKGESTNTIENKIKEVLKKMSGQDVELFLRLPGQRPAYTPMARSSAANWIPICPRQRCAST